MKVNVMYSCIFFLLGSFLSLSAIASDDASQLTQQLRKLETFSGQFKQTIVDSKGSKIQDDSIGDFWLKRPGYLYWETKQPFPQLLISNLKKVWLYDADLEQVTINNYDERLSHTPALLLGGDVDAITEQYQVVKLSQDSYRLVPMVSEGDSQELFSELTVFFENEQISKMVLLDSLAQLTTFTFIDGVYNQAINNGYFEFSPPEGTDIIRGN